MKVKISVMEKLLAGILVECGLSAADAKTVADDYILGEKDGKKSHGLMAFPSMIEKIKGMKRGAITIEKEGASFALINANRNFGQLAAKKARETAVRKARKNGIAIVGVYNMLPFLRPGMQAEMLEKEGLIGIVVNNGGTAAITPTGSIDCILATNPIGFSVPTKNEPITADFATAKRAWGEVRVAKTEGKKLPEETYMDKRGNFTLDPDEADSVVPFGDYKGYAIALLIEMLTGSLVNMPMGTKLRDKYSKQTLRGALFLAIDPKKFTNFNKFKRENSELVSKIKNSRKAKGVKEIFVPGERTSRIRRGAERRGYFEICEKLYSRIRALISSV